MAAPAAPRRIRTSVLLARGLTRRCPRCGARHIFSRWFRMVDRCPRCRYLFAGEAGFFLGAFVINFAVTEGSLGIVLAVLIALEAGGGTPLGPVVAAAVVVTVIVPLIFYPFSKSVWAAIDLCMHPEQQSYKLSGPFESRRDTDVTRQG